MEQHLTVPLLWSHVTPVLAYRQDVLHQQTAVVFSVGCTAVRTLHDLRHMFQQLTALQTWPTCREKVRRATRTSPGSGVRDSFHSALTFVSTADEEFNQAAQFSHLFLPRGQRRGRHVGFTGLHAFGLSLDVALQKSGRETGGEKKH